MKRILIVVFICLALGACSSKKQVSQSETSIREKQHKVFYVDTLLYTPASKTGLSLSISQLCDSLKLKTNWKSKSGNATAKATVVNDTLFLTAECDSIELRAQIKRELIKEFESNKKEHVEDNRTGISGFRYYSTVILTLIAGIAIGIIFKGFFIKLFIK